MKHFCDELSNTLEVSRNIHDVVAEEILRENQEQYKKHREGIRKIEWLLNDVDEIFERFENKLEAFIESKLIKFENFERKRGSQGERLVLSGNQMGALIMKDFLENLRKEREEFKRDAEKQIKILRGAYKSLERKVVKMQEKIKNKQKNEQEVLKTFEKTLENFLKIIKDPELQTKLPSKLKKEDLQEILLTVMNNIQEKEKRKQANNNKQVNNNKNEIKSKADNKIKNTTIKKRKISR